MRINDLLTLDEGKSNPIKPGAPQQNVIWDRKPQRFETDKIGELIGNYYWWKENKDNGYPEVFNKRYKVIVTASEEGDITVLVHRKKSQDTGLYTLPQFTKMLTQFVKNMVPEFFKYDRLYQIWYKDFIKFKDFLESNPNAVIQISLNNKKEFRIEYGLGTIETIDPNQ